MQNTINSLNQSMTGQKRISVKFYFNTLSRKRKIVIKELSMSTLHNEVYKLWVIQSGKFQLYRDSAYSQIIDETTLRNIKESTDESSTLKIYVKEVESLELSQKLEN
jgi:hypothetical protein